MTVLSAPTTINEETSSHPHDACGQACVVSCVDDFTGHSISIDQVEAIHSGPTWANDLSISLARFSVPNVAHAAALTAVLPAALAARHRLIFLHQCDGQANPVRRGSSKIAHWRVAYGLDAAGNLYTMNPWGGFDRAWPISAYAAADLGSSVEILGVMPGDSAPDEAQQPAEDDDMGVFGPAWNSKRPGRDDGDIFVFDEHSGHIWHHYEQAAVHKGSEDLGPPADGVAVKGVTGLYTGLPPTFIACRALVQSADGGMHVYERAGNYLDWKGWGPWVESG
jgi:hypothetical protein